MTHSLTLRQQLIAVSDAYCLAQGVSRARLSTVMLSGGRRLQMIEEGGDIKTGNFEAAMQWLSDNWPDTAVWPDDVARPAPAAREAAE